MRRARPDPPLRHDLPVQPRGAPPGPENFLAVLPNRLTIRGFIVLDHFELLAQFIAEVGPWVRPAS